MKVVIPSWHGRVSPVFDVACNFLVVDIENGREVKRASKMLGCKDLLTRIKYVSQLGTDVLICGAISWPLEITLHAAGVQVIAYICGPVDDVLKAFLDDTLRNNAFLMPGCYDR